MYDYKRIKIKNENFFSILIINLVEKLPNSIAGKTIANQIIRSGHLLEQTIELSAEREVIENLFLK